MSELRKAMRKIQRSDCNYGYTAEYRIKGSELRRIEKTLSEVRGRKI